jgi:hypothetical protein
VRWVDCRIIETRRRAATTSEVLVKTRTFPVRGSESAVTCGRLPASR